MITIEVYLSNFN